MFVLNQSHTRWVLLGLAGLMAATRFHHFGSIATLPDASLAVFFFAGLYLGRWWFFPIFLVEAGLIDYLAIGMGGVNAWCVSPAYGFLIPTYAVMWAAGRWCGRSQVLNAKTVLYLVSALFAGTAIAFLISNSGFYLFSGRFPNMTVFEYGARVAKYYPSYLASTLVYGAVIVCVHGLLHSIARTSSRAVTLR